MTPGRGVFSIGVTLAKQPKVDSPKLITPHGLLCALRTPAPDERPPMTRMRVRFLGHLLDRSR